MPVSSSLLAFKSEVVISGLFLYRMMTVYLCLQKFYDMFGFKCHMNVTFRKSEHTSSFFRMVFGLSLWRQKYQDNVRDLCQNWEH